MSDPWLIQKTRETNETEANEGRAENGSGGQEKEEQAKNNTTENCFEDNFAPSTAPASTHPEPVATNSNINDIEPLPDSASYLQGLERKLQKIKKGSKLVESLAEKRQDCMRALLQDEDQSLNNNNVQLELDTPLNNGDSTVQEIYRHLQPVQAATVGEIVHIVKYDHLEQQREEAGETTDDSEEGTSVEH